MLNIPTKRELNYYESSEQHQNLNRLHSLLSLSGFVSILIHGNKGVGKTMMMQHYLSDLSDGFTHFKAEDRDIHDTASDLIVIDDVAEHSVGDVVSVYQSVRHRQGKIILISQRESSTYDAHLGSRLRSCHALHLRGIVQEDEARWLLGTILHNYSFNLSDFFIKFVVNRLGLYLPSYVLFSQRLDELWCRENSAGDGLCVSMEMIKEALSEMLPDLDELGDNSCKWACEK